MPDAIRILANPGSARGRGARRLGELERLARRAGVPLSRSASAADLTARARRAAADGVERLLVAGGDGTLHHAIQGLAGTGCALGVVPLGSGNDLAGALGVPGAMEAAVERALGAPLRRIDLGRVGDRWFAGVAGAGFDSLVAERAHRMRLLRGGSIYVWAVVGTLVRFSPFTLTVEYEGGRFAGRAMFAVLANSPRYGGGMRIAPGARLDDGLLDLVLVEEVGKLELLRVFPRVFAGRHTDHPAVAIRRTRWATLAADRALPLYGDGEPMGEVGGDGLRIEVVPGALLVAG